MVVVLCVVLIRCVLGDLILVVVVSLISVLEMESRLLSWFLVCEKFLVEFLMLDVILFICLLR